MCINDNENSPNIFKNDVEIDYKSSDVSVKNISNMLRGRYPKYVL